VSGGPPAPAVFLSIVIPAWNEEHRLPSSLDRILAFLRSDNFGACEVIVVDDGSTDGTAALVERYAGAQGCVRLVRNPGNRGKGYAVRNGMLAAAGEWRLFTDADLSTPIEEVHTLFAAATERRAAVAIGSRALNRALVSVHQSVLREYSGRFFNLVVRTSSGLPFRDTQCGFKLYRGDAAQAIFALQQLDGFSFDVEDLYIASRLGFPAVEVPVRWANVEGTKVSALAGARSFVDALKVRWYAWQGRYERR
jgi:glycosyltransferase involved in cell wall biosynthesis